MKQYSAMKIRIYPNEDQKRIIENTFSAVRFMWNKLLEKSIISYDNPEEEFHIPLYGDIVRENEFLDKSNKEFKFDRHAVSEERVFLNQAFARYFNGLKNDKIKIRKDGKPQGFPRFKTRKHSKDSYSNYMGHTVHIKQHEHMIKIPRLKWVKYNPRERRIIPDDWIIKHITISKSTLGKYYCSICFEYEDDRDGLCGVGFVRHINDDIKILGLDYSSSSLYVDSNGDKANYPKYYRHAQKRLRMLNKQLSRRHRGSKGYNETLHRLRILHEKISNQRKDFLHKLSTAITKQNNVICVEDIDMKNISQCLRLGKSTIDNGFGMFRNMLHYKQDQIPYHIIIKADKWYPSSKRCSCCGNINKDLALKDRVYHCHKCGNVIDRDFNAAINLVTYGMNEINKMKIDCV